MAEPRLYPGERLVERLLARGERRLRVGVSSAFFARFGLDNPWDLDAADVGWGAPVWGLGGRRGRPRGVLGSFWALFDRRLRAHLMGGVLFRGGLGAALEHPWAAWLPFLDPSGHGWMWRDQNLGAFGRMPGFGFSRPRSPWGPFSIPRFSFLLPELEELEPEAPTAYRRFRRRPRRSRQAVSAELPLPVQRPLPEQVPPTVTARPAGVAPVPTPSVAARRVGAPTEQPVPAAVRAFAPAHAPLPLPPPPRARPPQLVGIARVLQREQAPVGGPGLRRAVARSASARPSIFGATPAPSATLAVPALQGPVAWAETRLQQATQASEAVRARPVPVSVDAGATQGLPPTARRALFPVLSRSPSLSFVQPTPEVDADQVPEADAAGASPRVATPAPPPEQVFAAPVPTPGVESRAPAPGRRQAATARVAQRLRDVQDATPAPSSDQPYRALRQVVPASATTSATHARPLLRALERAAPAPAPAPGRAKVADEPVSSVVGARSLDRLVSRPTDAPGLPGRLQDLTVLSSAQARERGVPSAVVRAARPTSPFAVRSPMLAFLDAIDQAEPAFEDESQQPGVVRPRRVRPSADRPAAPARRVVRQAASRALLRAAAPPDRGSVLPRPVARVSSERALTPLSETGFPGRRHLAHARRELEQTAATVTRAMRVPWLPVDRLVQPTEPLLDEQADVPARAARAARARAQAQPRAARARPAPPVSPTARPVRERAARPLSDRPVDHRALPAAAPAPLRASARAVARLAEVQPQPTPRVPRIDAPGAAPRVRAAQRAVTPSPTVAGRTRPARVAPQSVLPARIAAVEPSVPPSSVAPSRRSVREPSADALRPTGTQRALHRLEAGPVPRAWAPVSQALASPMRPFRDAGSSTAPVAAALPPAAGPAPAVVGRAPVGPSPMSARVEPPASRLRRAPQLPSGRALGRLAVVSRAHQRAVAVAGGGTTPPVGHSAPRTSLIQPDSPAAQPPPARPARGGAPRQARAARGRAVASRSSTSQARVAGLSAIDKLLAEGTGAQVLIPALARIERPDEVLRIVLERTLGWRGRGPLPAPVRHLVEQVQAAAQPEESARRSRRPSRETLRRDSGRRRPASSRRRPQATPLTPASATVHHVQANYRIVGLVKKLEQLIHLVDVEHRLAAARSQVRMAEDSPAARSPGSPDASPEAEANQAGQDVDSLVQHIVEFVSEEMSLLSMRRPEAPRDRSPWY